MKNTDDYELLDSGDGRKLERFGHLRLERPCAQAIWRPALAAAVWAAADAGFDRKEGNRWHNRSRLPEFWDADIGGVRFRLSSTDFGHLGVFPEQRRLWGWSRRVLRQTAVGRELSVLNLFAYSGGATLAAAQAGARVCHLDASKQMVARARENAGINGLEAAPIRWIVDDVTEFLKREARRGSRYDAIILDPPTYGHGSKGQIFKIERDLCGLLDLCQALLSEQPLFVILSCHTPQCQAGVLANLLRDLRGGGGGFALDAGEMCLTGAPEVKPLPCGTYAVWRREGLPSATAGN